MIQQQLSLEQLQQVLSAMVALPEKDVTTETKEGDTETIIIPRGMSKLTAAKELEKQHKEEETEVQLVHEMYQWDRKDALAAFIPVAKRTFGWLNYQSSWFSSPTEIRVCNQIVDGEKQFIDCYLGNFKVTSWDDAKGQISTNSSGTYVVINAKKKFKARVNAFFKELENELKSNSIYKGKSTVYSNGEFEVIENRGATDIILNPEEERVLSHLILNSLEERGKKCYLFTGPYGTGKTETAMRVGREANGKEITFIYCKQASEFTTLLKKAVVYQPAIVFLEDIDEIGSGEDRNTEINSLLNTLDGVETKGNDLTVIFTTNHEKKINKALRRPGRIDIILRFSKCTKETVEKIYRSKFSGIKNGDKLDYVTLAGKTPDVQGAVVAEISSRAKKMAKNGKIGITDEIVEAAIDSMKFQIAFMDEDVENTKDPLHQGIENIVNSIKGELVEKLDDIRDQV